MAVFTLILRFSKTGQYILAIGGNAEAVRLSGINVSRYVTLTYVISGVLAAFAALGSSSPSWARPSRSWATAGS